MTELFGVQWHEFALRTLALHWLTSTVIVALVVAFVSVCRQLNATTRHNIWLLTLVSVVLMPLLIFVPRPTMTLPALTLIKSVEQGADSSITGEATQIPAPVRSADRARFQQHAAQSTPQEEEALSTVLERTDSDVPVTITRAGSWSLPVLVKGIFLFWLVGALYLMRRLWGEYRGARELELQSDSVTPYFERRFDQLCSRLGIEHRPLLRFHPGINAPMTVGLLRVWVAIPMTWRETIDDSVFDQTLTHELGHIARKDPMTHTLQRMLQVVLWMYPAVWFVARQLEVERESACDDWVLTHDSQRNSYAANLLDVAESLYLQPRVMAVGCLRSHSQLSRRIQNLLSKRSDHKVSTSWKQLLLLGVGMTGTLGVSAVVWPDARQLAPPAAPVPAAVADVTVVSPKAPPSVDIAAPAKEPRRLKEPTSKPAPAARPAPVPSPAAAPFPSPAPDKVASKGAFEGKTTTVWQNEQGKLAIERKDNRVSVTVEPPIDSDTPLLEAAWRGDMKMLWQLAGEQPERLNTVFDRAQPPRTALEAALLKGHKRLVEKMIHLGVNLNPGDPRDRKNGVENPVTIAAMTGNYGLVKLLLKKGAVPETRTLTVAVDNGDLPIVELLLKKNSCDCLSLDESMITAIHNKNEQLVELLLSFDAGVADSALLLAVQGNRTRLVDLLLTEYDDEPGNDLLKLAIDRRNTGILKSLLKAGAEPGEDTMLLAVQSRNANLVKQLLEHDADTDEGALVLAIQLRDTRMVDMLIEGEAPISDGALTMAIQQGDTQVAHRLLSHESAVGEGPLIMAIQTGNEAMVRVLLDRGAEVGEGALLMAAQTGNKAIMQLVRERSGRSEADLQSSVLRSFDSGKREAAYFASTNAAASNRQAELTNVNRNKHSGDDSVDESPFDPHTHFKLKRWPVDSHRISMGYYDTSPKYGSHKELHQALDFPIKEGSPVYAVAAGTVVDVGFSKGYGNYVVIDHGNGITAKYANNKTNKVTEGQRVRSWQKIATVGSTAHDSTGPHLHFELKHGNQKLDPEALFASDR